MNFSYNNQISKKIEFKLSYEHAQRQGLENISNLSFGKEIIQSNGQGLGKMDLPLLNSTSINRFSSNILFWPDAQISKDNGIQTLNKGNTLVGLGLTFAGGQTRYNQIEISAQKSINFGNKRLNIRTESGGFIGQKPLYFVDFKHFNGNQTLIQTHNDFRLLDYYQFSTNEYYEQFFANLTLNKLLFSQINFLKQKGINESIFGNYLITNKIKHTEIGYGISYFQDLIKLELVSAFENTRFSNFGFRLKIKN